MTVLSIVYRTLDLLVAYVDGVHRLEVQAKGVECRVSVVKGDTPYSNHIMCSCMYLHQH